MKYNPKIIKAEMMEPYVKSTSPNIIVSGGLGPCIAVGAIYKAVGYMVHFHSISFSEWDLKSLVDLLITLNKEIKNKSKLKIYIAGAGSDPGDSKEEKKLMIKDRNVTLETIAKHKLSDNLEKVEWRKTSYMSQELVLDLKDGEAIFFMNSYPSHLNIPGRGS